MKWTVEASMDPLGVAGEEEGLDLLAFATQDERPVARRGSSEQYLWKQNLDNPLMWRVTVDWVHRAFRIVNLNASEEVHSMCAMHRASIKKASEYLD